MARQLTISICVFGFLGFASSPAISDDIGVGKPANGTTSTTQNATTDDDIGVGEESWYAVFLQLLEADDSTES